MEPKTEAHSAQNDSDLTHDKAKWILERLNPDIDRKRISEQDREAIKHYMPVMRGAGPTQGYDYLCKDCSQDGLAYLIDLHLDCKKAIEEFARMLPLSKNELSEFAGRFWPGHNATTLRQLIAIEHIFGRPPYCEERRPEQPQAKACKSGACTNIRKSFLGVSTTDPGLNGRILSHLIALFDDRGWVKDELLTQQKVRIREITEHAVSAREFKEIMRHISSLQNFI